MGKLVYSRNWGTREVAVEEEEKEQLTETGKTDTRSRTTFLMSSASPQATQGGSGQFCAKKDRI